MLNLNQATRRITFNRLSLLGVIAWAAMLAPSASFGIEILNQQGAKEIAENAKLPGSVSTGWRVFQQRCASCHGSAAEGTDKAPDLLPRVRQMGAERFSNLVLKRYDWSATPAAANNPAPAGQAVMPAWQSNPMVNAHIVDLYAYLSARSEGSQGPGQPAP
ncbi:cytochrome c [Paucibacter sp. B2R-40]|uniref:c-type cytochrome n=1 Tax=Paucibacter sp. B2R-40 TaxID=2893554 RepID=UPI0021E504F2|nr:cytochrome c [Paucibacter sp. B2R-40]MCV2353030.1 cytochrome c [Paucibacter sp. B2R-40]